VSVEGLVPVAIPCEPAVTVLRPSSLSSLSLSVKKPVSLCLSKRFACHPLAGPCLPLVCGFLQASLANEVSVARLSLGFRAPPVCSAAFSPVLCLSDCPEGGMSIWSQGGVTWSRVPRCHLPPSVIDPAVWR
jgi:hypothetical protein